MVIKSSEADAAYVRNPYPQETFADLLAVKLRKLKQYLDVNLCPGTETVSLTRALTLSL